MSEERFYIKKLQPIREFCLNSDKEDVYKYIYSLQQENEKLKGQYCERTDCGGRIGNSKKVEELIKENEILKREIDKLHTIRNEYGYVIENINIVDDYKLTQLIHNKYLIELKDGRFVDINEVVKENEKLNHYKLLYQKVKDRNDKVIEYINNLEHN